MATIKDVSRQARVSIKTVSRVINGSPEVAEATRQHVLATIEQLGYRPSALGQRLVTGKASAIGVVIPRTAGYVFGHQYFHEVLRGIGDVLGRNQLDLLLHLGRDDSDYALLVHRRKVDGLILLSIPLDDHRASSLIGGDVPAVFTCRATAGHNPTNWVDCDPATGIDEAVEHLVALGHREIGFLQGPTQLMLPRLQLDALRGSLRGHELELREEWVLSGDYSFEAGSAHARRLLELPERPSALLCSDDMIAIGAIGALAGAGTIVPRDCSVIGFDDVVIARYLTPPLTTIRQDAYGKGQRAAELLIDLIARGSKTEAVHETLPTRLMIRQSTAPPPARRGGSHMA
jgi:DNA-binding LacI/PurR family transcriptional regulator